MLSLVGISVLLVWLDPVLAVIVLAGFVPLAAAHPLVPAPLAGDLPAHPHHGRPADRAVRRVDERHPRGAGLPPGGAQRRDHGRPRRAPTATPTPTTIRTVAWYVGALRGVGNLTLALVLAVGGLRVAGGALELGVLTAFLLYLRRFYDPLDELAQFFNAYQSAAAALEKIAAVLDTPPDVPEPAAPVPLPSPVRGRAAVRRRCGSPTGPTGGAPCCRSCRSTVPAGPDGGAGRRHRGGQVDAGQAGRAVLRPDGGRGHRWTASTCATSPTPSCAARW